MSTRRFIVYMFLILLAAFLLSFSPLIVHYCCGAELTISEPLAMVPVAYSNATLDMTPEEFFQWATARNLKAKAEWQEWRETAPRRWVHYDETAIDGWHYNPHQRSETHTWDVHRTTSSAGQGEAHYRIKQYTKRYLNPEYRSRPLLIINPFCPPK